MVWPWVVWGWPSSNIPGSIPTFFIPLPVMKCGDVAMTMAITGQWQSHDEGEHNGDDDDATTVAAVLMMAATLEINISISPVVFTHQILNSDVLPWSFLFCGILKFWPLHHSYRWFKLVLNVICDQLMSQYCGGHPVAQSHDLGGEVVRKHSRLPKSTKSENTLTGQCGTEMVHQGHWYQGGPVGTHGYPWWVFDFWNVKPRSLRIHHYEWIWIHGSCDPWVFPRVNSWVPVSDPDSCPALFTATSGGQWIHLGARI